MPDRIEPGLVALRLAPGPGFAAALDEIWERGDAVLPLSPDLSRPAADRLIAAMRPTGLRDDDGERSLPGGQAVAAGTALVVATSGSTGRPKGVELSHGALDASARASLARLGSGPGDRWIACLPLDHVAGLAVLRRARLCGTEPVVLHRFDPATVAKAPGTHIALVPTMLARLLDAGVDVARFACVLLGGAAAPADLVSRSRLAGARLVVTYGLTETCGGCVYDGLPLDGVQLRLDDGQRICMRGPMLFTAYRGDPAMTAASLRDGWLRTADLGAWDDAGRLRVLGRVDDVVVTGGHNVSLSAAAALLRTHPLVADAAVIGVADAEWGQRLVAYVVPCDPARPPTLDELRTHTRAHAPAPQAPKDLVLVHELPRSGLGKVARAHLPDR